MRQVWKTSLATLLSLMAAACALVGDRADWPRREASAFAPYWYVDDRTISVLEIKNLLHAPLTLQPTVTYVSGASLVLDPITVAPQATARHDLTPELLAHAQPSVGSDAPRWGDGTRPNSRLGSAVLTAVGPEDAVAESFSAWIVIEDRAEGLGLVTPFHPAHPVEHATRLDGLWWLPFEDVHAYLAVQNPARYSAALSVDLYGDGRLVASRSVMLAAGGARLIDLRSLLGSAAAGGIGGVRLRFDTTSAPGGIVARGMLVQEERGFSTPVTFYETSRTAPVGAPAQLQAPVAIFGDLGRLVKGARNRMRPHLLLRNTAAKTVTLEGVVNGKDAHGRAAGFALPAMHLTPKKSAVVDLEAARQASGGSLADGVAGLHLSHDGGPTDLVAELINVSETGSLALYDHIRNQAFHESTEQVAISFNLTGGRRSFIIVKNTTDEPRPARILIDYGGSEGAYDVEIGDIAPQQITVVDIKRLRDERVPDRRGRLLPGSVDFGGARVFGEPGTLVSSDPTFFVSDDDPSAVVISVSCMVFRFPGLGPPSGGGGSAPSCQPKLFSGQGVDQKNTLIAGGDTFEFNFEAGGNLGGGQLTVASRVDQIIAPNEVLAGPTTNVELTVSCDAQCNPGFTCSTANCTNELTGADSLDHMTARALIDAFISSLGLIEADASGEAIVNNLAADSGHFQYTWFCD